jgi:hypothetical protein
MSDGVTDKALARTAGKSGMIGVVIRPITAGTIISIAADKNDDAHHGAYSIGSTARPALKRPQLSVSSDRA